jgi:two-component system CheB/CheR fusion protein
MKKKETRPDPPGGIADARHSTSIEEVGPATDEDFFPIVGIGASAGGLEAFQALFDGLPERTGMGYVLIQHLAPNQESLLAEILQRHTTMPVMQVTDEPAVLPNHVYIIPPGRDMIIEEGNLKLMPRELKRGIPRPIDQFLRSLAEDQTHRSIGVILSGTGDDGTLGLEAIKAEGGITFAQDHSAKYDSMPQSAISAGCVDYIMPPGEMAGELHRIGTHPLVAFGKNGAPTEASMPKIIRVLHDRMGIDFTNYRSSTLLRRLSRRMLLHKMESIDEYLRLLRSDPLEVQSLYRDILISVTSFFRDPGAYESLCKHVFPRLLKNRSKSEPVRIWILGCSSGEEAYSIAITLHEFASTHKIQLPIQVFATDLNELGIEKARAGVYPKSIAHDVSAPRLKRFFLETETGYQVSKPIRDMCIFAKQNVLTDPPFSRLDFISCRNLLIYLEPVLQRKVIPLFHYALKPDGFLWLGSSETIGQFGDLFETLDSKHRIYSRKANGATLGALAFATPAGENTRRERPPRRIVENTVMTDMQREADRIALARYSPPSVLVNSEMEILQFRGDTGAYLAPAPGKPSLNLLKMARPGLLVGLRAALQKSIKDGLPVRQDGLEVKSAGGMRQVDVEVIPLTGLASEEQTFMVLFEEPGRQSQTPYEEFSQIRLEDRSASMPETEVQLGRVTQELAATRDYLQSMIEQQEAANEELQSANEEIQSSNEELQSINEELQTSKEEIQSANEELTTVNEELRNRNEQLDQSNGDLANVLSSINQPVVVLERNLTIRRFTPSAERVFNFIAADVGRPITDVNLPFEGIDLEKHLHEVIDSVKAYETEIQDRRGQWYSLRLLPYRSLDNKVDGAVLFLADISVQKQSQSELQSARDFAETIVENVPTPLLVLSGDQRVLTASHSFYDTFNMAADETAGVHVFALGSGQWDIPELRRMLDDIIPRQQQIVDFEVSRDFEEIGYRTMLINAKRLEQAVNKADLILFSIQDITDRLMARRALEEADRRKDEFLAMLAHELRNPLAAMTHTIEISQATGDEKIASGLSVMRRQTQKLRRLVDDLLDVSRISRGAIILKYEVVDLNQTMQHAIEVIRHDFEARNQNLEVSLPKATLRVNGDPVRLEQVFGNLMHNASKYTPAGGKISVTLSRDKRKRDQAGFAIIEVADNGIGIGPEMLGHVFDLYAQVDTSLKRDESGQGIGLSVVQELVRLHRGTVEVNSPGKGLGSRFTIRLPLTENAQETTAPEMLSEREATSENKTYRIMIVDDNVDGADSLGLILKFLGHDVKVAYDGESGLKLLDTFNAEVVLCDLAMPGMDGIEFIQQVRGMKGITQPFLVGVTGFSQSEYQTLARDAGANAFMVKPLELTALAEELAKLESCR